MLKSYMKVNSHPVHITILSQQLGDSLTISKWSDRGQRSGSFSLCRRVFSCLLKVCGKMYDDEFRTWYRGINVFLLIIWYVVMINDNVLLNAFIMQLRCYFGFPTVGSKLWKILHKQTGCHLLSFSSAWHWTDSVSLLCILRRVLSQIFQYLYHMQANKNRTGKTTEPGTPMGLI